MTNEYTGPNADPLGAGRQGRGQTPKRIGQMLVEAGLVTEAQLDEALRQQSRRGGKIVEVLISLGYLEASAFIRFLAHQPGMASIHLDHYEVPQEIVGLVPREFAITHEVFPIDRLGNLLTLGMVCPLDGATIRKLEEDTGLRVKPILCAPADIRSAIQRYYRDTVDEEGYDEAPSTASPSGGLEDLAGSIRLSTVAHLVRQIQHLPTLPATVRRVKAAMEEPDSSLKEVARVIAQDPPLTAKVLSVANSASYGFPRKVSDIGMAVSLLGLRETYAIAVGASVIDLFDTSKNFDYKAFWRASLWCATATLVLARRAANCPQTTGLFAAGLIHDIGRIALSEVAPDRYARVGAGLEGEDLLEAEEKVVGFTHTEAGYELAEHWELPATIAHVIRFHHRPDQAPTDQEAASIVCLANHIAKADSAGNNLNEGLFTGYEPHLERCGIDPGALEAILDEYLAQKEALAASGIAD